MGIMKFMSEDMYKAERITWGAVRQDSRLCTGLVSVWQMMTSTSANGQRARANTLSHTEKQLNAQLQGMKFTCEVNDKIETWAQDWRPIW